MLLIKMLKFTHLAFRTSKSVGMQNLMRSSHFSSVTTALAQNIAIENEVVNKTDQSEQLRQAENNEKETVISKSSNSMVTAAFAALKSNSNEEEIVTPQTDAKLKNAKSVKDLLSISNGIGVSRKHALNVMSILSEWCSSGKAKLSDFETDPSFIRLCRILTKGVHIKPEPKFTVKSEDLSVVTNVAADDEAAKLVGGISLPQMVKVFGTLAQQKRRSTSLLRALAYNLSGAPQTLNIKQCGDVLYSAAILNFYDSNLLEKVCEDVRRDLTNELKKSAVLGSILTSLGLLRYKEIDTLDKVSSWFLRHYDICRPQDIFALFQTSAVLNHCSPTLTEIYKKMMVYLEQAETCNPLEWLDIVWSLVLLNLATENHVSSVLKDEFVESVDLNTCNIATKLKLLNINAHAQYLLKGYSGPILSNLNDLKLVRSKDKDQMVSALLDTLKNLMAEWCLRTNINTNMGFLLDAECFVDKKCNPVALKKVDESQEQLIKVGILVQEYHDFCRGRVEPTGVSAFAIRLLEAREYAVLTVPYTEFRARDKIVRRVQYIESQLKQIVKQHQTLEYIEPDVTL